MDEFLIFLLGTWRKEDGDRRMKLGAWRRRLSALPQQRSRNQFWMQLFKRKPSQVASASLHCAQLE